MEAFLELEHAIGFKGMRNSLHVHPNGKDYIYVAGACIAVADLVDPHEQSFLRGHDESITCMCVSPSGKYVVSGQQGNNSDAVVWDFATSRVIYRLEEHDYAVASVSMSKDEKLLLTCGNSVDKKLVVWDMSIAHIVCTQSIPFPDDVVCSTWAASVRDIKHRETGEYQFAIAGGCNLHLYLLDPMKGVMTSQPLSQSTYQRRYNCMQFSEDSTVLFVGTESGDVGVYSMKSKQLACSVQVCGSGVKSLLIDSVHSAAGGRDANGGFQYARFAAAGSTQLYVGGGDGTIAAYHCQDHSAPALDEKRRMTVDGPVTCLSLSPVDSSLLLLGTAIGSICSIETNKIQPSSKPSLLSLNLLSCVTGMDFNPERSDIFATTTEDGYVRVWDLNSYGVLSISGGKNTGARQVVKGDTTNTGTIPTCVSYVGSIDVMITGWTDGGLRAYDATNGELLWTIDSAHRSAITGVVTSSNMKFCVTCGSEGEIRMWELKTKELVSNLKEHTGKISRIIMFGDDCHLLSVGKDKQICAWDLREEKRISSHNQRMGSIHDAALFANQTQFLTVGAEKKVSMWDFRQPTPIAVVPYDAEKDSDAYGLAVNISYDQRFFVTGGNDQLVKLWDTKNLTCVQEGVGHSAPVTAVAFSPDDKQVVSGGGDSCIFVWNVYTK